MNPASPRVSPPRRSHAERSAATQAQVLEAAAQVVRTSGFQAATMFEVAKAAGVTPGALQHHFGSKAELMLQLLERALNLGTDDIAGPAWPQATQPLAQRAQQFVQTLWGAAYEPPRFLVAWGIYFGHVGDAEVMARVVAIRARLRAELHRRFNDAFPELAGTPGAEAFADLVLSALRGLAVGRVFGPSPETCAAQLHELAATIEQRCLQHAAPTSPRPRGARPTAARRPAR